MIPEFIIRNRKQVIVEGLDDVRIVESLCRHLEINDVAVQQCGGYDSLRPFLRAFVSDPEFAQVRSLAVIVDADSDAISRRQGVADALLNASLPRPERPLEPVSESGLSVTYLVVPHDGGGTMMEDVCLSSVRDDPAMACVDRYFECISRADTLGPRPVWTAKARVHAFLASRERPDLRLGEAAQRGVWRFGTDAFRPMTSLLAEL